MSNPVNDGDTSPRRPWLALLLSILTPGLGHVYSGRAGRGGYLLLGLFLPGAALLLASMYVPYAPMRVGSLLFVAASATFIHVDAWRTARRTGSGFLPRPYNRWYVYVALIFIAVYGLQPALRNLMHRTVAEAFTIPGNSMAPTIVAGDYLLAAPRMSRPMERGSVAVFRREGGLRVLQRLVALPGDTVEMRTRALFINGEEQAESYVRHMDVGGNPSTPDMLWQRAHLPGGIPAGEGYLPSRDDWGPLVIPAGHYFLLGDNRDNSLDSRYLGLVADADLIGRAEWVYFSRDPGTGTIRWNRIGLDIR